MAKRGRPSRADMAARAAQESNAASEAGRVLQAQRHFEPANEPAPDETGHPTEPRDDTPPPPPRNEERRLAMEEIENRHLKTLGIEPEVPRGVQEEKSEEKVEENLEDKPKDESKTEKVEGEAKPADVAIPAFLDQKPADAKPVETVRVKVDGEEFDVPKADVEAAGSITAYQKERAADNRLRKTNEALAQTRQTQAQIAAWIQAQTPKQPVQSDDEFLQTRIQAINFGSPDEQVQAAKELRAKITPNINQDQIVQRAVIAMQQEAAESQFVNEFSDIVHNPLLLKLILNLKHERLSQLKEVPDWGNFYRSIGNEVRGAIGRPSQPAKPSEKAPDSTSPVDKEARKASIVNLPTAAARAELQKEEKPETREDILHKMRKARGIPTG